MEGVGVSQFCGHNLDLTSTRDEKVGSMLEPAKRDPLERRFIPHDLKGSGKMLGRHLEASGKIGDRLDAGIVCIDYRDRPPVAVGGILRSPIRGTVSAQSRNRALR